MKLVTLVLASLVSFGGIAAADHGPRPERAQLRQMLDRKLIARFDRNHDGRLEPREKRQAIRALRRLARKLAMSEQRGPSMQRIIRRYDRNGDGNVGPREMPRGMADRLRPLDRNGDGWVNDADFGPGR